MKTQFRENQRIASILLPAVLAGILAIVARGNDVYSSSIVGGSTAPGEIIKAIKAGDLVSVAPQDHFEFTTNNNAITITKYKGPGGDVVVPSEIAGLPVTTFKKTAFWKCVHVTSITIQPNVTNVGDKDEGYNWTIDRTPDGIDRKDASVFALCNALTNITVAEGNSDYASIDGVLFDRDLTTLIKCPPGRAGSYSVPEGVTSISTLAFSCCSGLTNVTIPSSVATIQDWAFSFCYGLDDLAIPASVTRISTYAFRGCFGLKNISVDADSSAFTSVDGVLFDKTGTRLIRYPAGRKGHYSIPSGTTSFNYHSFDDCTGLTSITIPASVTSMSAESLLNSSVHSGLTNIAVHAEHSVFSSEDGVLFNKTGTSLLCYPKGRKGHYDIPAGVTSIGNSAFSCCSELSSLTLPVGVTNIGSYAFFGCDELTTVKIPASVTRIQRSAFCANSSCPKILLFEGDAPEIGTHAFGFRSIISTIYYRPGTKGWGETFGGRPTKEWDGAEEPDPFFTPRESNSMSPLQPDVQWKEARALAVSKVIFNPPSPGILNHGECLTCTIHYEIDSDGEFSISGDTLFKGLPVRSDASRASWRHWRGKGWEDYLWRFKRDAKIDQIKISFLRYDAASNRRDLVKEFYVDVDYEFRDKYADAPPNSLYEGIRISVNMSLPNADKLRDAFSRDGAKRVDTHDCGPGAQATSIGADVGSETVRRALELGQQHMPNAKKFYILYEDELGYRKTINFGSGLSPKIPDAPPELLSKLMAPDLTLEECHSLINAHNGTVQPAPAPVQAAPPAVVPAPAPAQPAAALKVGDPAPPLAQGKFVQGEPVAGFEKGKAYVVEFWATWCGPCRTVIPHVNKLQEKYKDKGLVVIGQNVWQRGENVESDVTAFVKQMGADMTYRVALDRDGAMAETWMKAAGRKGIPAAFVVDREGKIAWVGHPSSGLDEAVEKALGGASEE